MSIEEHSRHDVNNPVDVSSNPQEVRSREECIKSVASDYISTFPNLSFADINEPQVLLTLLHQLGVFLRDQKFDFHQPYQLEEKILESDARAALKYTKQRAGHPLSEPERIQRLNGWAGEMVVKLLLDIVYECAEKQGVTNVPHRHHHNERENFFPKTVTSALNVHVGAQFGAGRFVRFDLPSTDSHRRRPQKCEIDLLAGVQDHIFLIDVTTDARRVHEKLQHSSHSPLSHFRTCLEQMRYKAFNIVCAVTPTIDRPVVARDHQGRNYAGTVPLHSQVEDFAQRYMALIPKN